MAAWVKERFRLASERIRCGYRAALKLIAAPAGKAEVLEFGFAAVHLRNDMVNGHRLAGVGFACVTIRTEVIVCVEQPIP
jgi:hypothetical protein